MKRKNRIILLAFAVASFAILTSAAQTKTVPNWSIDPDKELNPNTQWLLDAKWGMFTHYTIYPPNHPIGDMNAEKWNEKVNSFQVEKFADQLEKLLNLATRTRLWPTTGDRWAWIAGNWSQQRSMRITWPENVITSCPPAQIFQRYL